MSQPLSRQGIQPEQPGIVRATIDIAAPIDEVFRALADPQELAAWLGEGTPAGERSDEPPHAHVGTSWRAHVLAPDGTAGVVLGQYAYVVPPHFLESTWEASWNQYVRERVSFSLVSVEVGGVAGTRVMVTHTRAAARLHVTTSTLSRTNDVSTAEAWASSLPRLAAHVAASSSVARWGSPHTGTPDAWFDALHRAIVDTHHAH